MKGQRSVIRFRGPRGHRFYVSVASTRSPSPVPQTRVVGSVGEQWWCWTLLPTEATEWGSKTAAARWAAANVRPNLTAPDWRNSVDIRPAMEPT